MNMHYCRNRFKFDENNVFITSVTTIKKKVEFFDVTGPLWNVFYIHLTRGSFKWKTKDSIVTPKSNKFFIFLPKNSLCIDIYENAEVNLVGLYSNSKCPINENRPFYFDLDPNEPTPNNYEELINLFEISKNIQYIDYNNEPHLTALRIKTIIDQQFQENITVTDITKIINKAPAVTSRLFKSNFGFSPKQYLNLIKICYGEFLLGLGKDINDVIFETGFRDFSRFYKVFKEKMKDTPKGIKDLIYKK